MICHGTAIASLPATESHSRADDFEICAATNDRIDESVRSPLSSKSRRGPAISWTASRSFFLFTARSRKLRARPVSLGVQRVVLLRG